MAQNDLVVVGLDVAKDKVDACIRAFALRQTCPNTTQGHRKLVAWLRRHQVGKAVMEASGGYEREWRKVLHNAGIEVRIVDPKRVRSFALWRARNAQRGTTDLPVGASAYFRIKTGRPNQLEWIFEFAFFGAAIEMTAAADQPLDAPNLLLLSAAQLIRPDSDPAAIDRPIPEFARTVSAMSQLGRKNIAKI